MPRLAVLAAAPGVGHGVNAALLDPGDHVRPEVRRLARREAAVGVKHRRVLPVLRQIALARDEHRDARAVLALVENAIGLKARRVEGQLWRVEGPARVVLSVVDEGRRRHQRGSKSVEDLRPVEAPHETARAPESRHRHLAFEFPFERVQPHDRSHILQRQNAQTSGNERR